MSKYTEVLNDLRQQTWRIDGESAIRKIGSRLYVGSDTMLSVRVAAKPHRCSFCGRAICVADWYIHFHQIGGGNTDRRCSICNLRRNMPKQKSVVFTWDG